MRQDRLGLLLEPWLSNVDQREECLLVDLLAHLQRRDTLGEVAARERLLLTQSVESLLKCGYTLRHGFPNVPRSLQQEWLGSRLILGHSRLYRGDTSCTSIVSSRLGRYGRRLACWPSLIELLLRSIRRNGAAYFAVPDTTVAPLIEPLLARSAVPHLQVRLPARDAGDVAAWLAEKLSAIAAQNTAADRELHLSPQRSTAHDALEPWPLQDRIAVCCAVRVRALLVRPQGAIAYLLKQRLADPRFNAGTVSVFLPSTIDRSTSRARMAQLAWLEQGAVGWYVRSTEPSGALLGCRQRQASHNAPLWQLTSNCTLFPFARAASEADVPRYLVHCVRGSPGALPSNAAGDRLAHAWLSGRLPDDSPLATLVQVLASGCLRGRTALYRSDQPCVSFSAVPLVELIRRRVFQPHLGRWDWEPFGLMIERRALEAFGARPVIYGDEETYRQLSAEDRPFFQPAQRRRGAHFGRREWKEESEWRVIGDVRLSELPREAVQIFVAYRNQAQSLARHVAWPVIWLQDAQTRVLPTRPVRRTRTEAQTGRS